ncbi:granulocyte colony-stimulating factor receptor [Pelobates cultripes]|uniref:Granulocyte colony-stimulating factor receptor n=2 Tax=Pelobates cultripes TaxID=61616 RepID=A0AAD1VMG3_PELCU|nr:granulocyte colony-stimulating factor receptor [Pelobates cultripes]
MRKNWCIMLVGMMLLIFLPGGSQSCDSITVNSPLIFGSRLTATCTVSRTLCRGLEEDEFQFKWKLDNDFIPSSQYMHPFKNTTTVTLDNFNKSSALLSCYIIGASKRMQLIDRKDVKAGYPPSPPTNLSCLMNLFDDKLNCTWELGKDPLIQTNVTLSSIKATSKCEASPEVKENIIPKEYKTSALIPRKQFNLYKKLAVSVTVKNALGSATSTICLVPGHEVKLDPPVIEEATASVPGCVKLQWRNGKTGFYIVEQTYQLRYRKEDEKKWTEPADLGSGLNETSICGILSATKYHFQLRSIRASKTGVWSEWGHERTITTLESAPTGKLETWWKQTESKDGLQGRIQLLWKALKKHEANADHMWYVVKRSSGYGSNDAILCNTTALNCSFSPSIGVMGATVWAYNTAGHSQGTEITFSIKKGELGSNFQVFPNDNYSLRVEWETKPSAKGYILEWYESSNNPDIEINWKREPQWSRNSVLNENIKPFQLYIIKLFPLYEEGVGAPVQKEMYSRQRAPDLAPKLTLIRASKSQAELSWEPIPLESQHGFITGYTIYWTDPNGVELFADLKATSREYVIGNLDSLTVYKVVLSISTSGGSTNGTVMTIYTTLFDENEVNMLIMVLCLSFITIIIVTFILCIMKHERMKKRFWPSIPDPANSSMGKWDSVKQEKPRMTLNTRDVNQIITSDITILEGWAGKKPATEDLPKDTPIFPQDHSVNFHVQSQSIIENMNTLMSYVNVLDTVQYAKVITGGYREQSPPSSLYIRSESTQPLLGDTSPSPTNYENMWFHCQNQEDSVFFMEEESQTHFPLLQELKIQDEEEPFCLYS